MMGVELKVTNQRGGEKWPHLGKYFEKKLSGMDSKLSKGYKRKRMVKIKLKFWT